MGLSSQTLLPHEHRRSPLWIPVVDPASVELDSTPDRMPVEAQCTRIQGVGHRDVSSCHPRVRQGFTVLLTQELGVETVCAHDLKLGQGFISTLWQAAASR